MHFDLTHDCQVYDVLARHTRLNCRLADFSFILTTKCRRIRAQQSASSLNFVLHQLARVLRFAQRMRSRRYLQAPPHQLIRDLLAHRVRATLPRGIPRA